MDLEEISLNTNYRRSSGASTGNLAYFNSNTSAPDLTKKDRTLSGRLSRVSSHSSLPSETRTRSRSKKLSKYTNPSLSNLSELDDVSSATQSKSSFSSPTTSPRHSRASVPEQPIVLPKRQSSKRQSSRSSRKKILQSSNQSFVDDDDDEDAIDVDDISAWNIPLAPSLYQKTRQSSSKLALETLGAASHSHIPNNNNNSMSSSSANSTTSTMVSCDDPNTPEGSFTVPRIMDMSSLFETLSPIAQELSVAFTESPKALQHELKRNSNSSTNSSSSITQSCTRPAFLPPKDKKEEKKHLREYQRMVEERAAAEKAQAAKEAKKQEERNKKKRENAFRWKSEIIPNFQTAIQNPATRELWWGGIPSASRGFVWTERIGNSLGLSQPQFDKFCKTKTAFTNITNSTYPELGMFGPGSPYHDDLVTVLRAHESYWKATETSKPQTEKLACAAASLILALGSPFQSWVALENLVNRGHLIKPMYDRDDQVLVACYTSFLKVFSTRLPSLYRHFQTQNISPSAYLDPLIMTFFTNHFSLDVTFRIWDVMLFEGDSFMFRVVLATLSKLEPYLYGSKAEIMAQLQSDKLKNESEDNFMDAVRQVLRVN